MVLGNQANAGNGQRGLLYDDHSRSYFIQELEVSIHNRCNLQCNECGFFVPNQPVPYNHDAVQEIVEGLKRLQNLNINIGMLVVVGGEPLLVGNLLSEAVRAFKAVKNVKRLEVVSNGLYPQGLPVDALPWIDQFTISLYFQSSRLLTLWEGWIRKHSRSTEFVVRDKTGQWDKWWGNFSTSFQQAQLMYDSCFYRRHCTTLERELLFPCSRMAKVGCDDEGLPLTDTLSLQQVEAYLNAPMHFSACRFCTPMMGLPKVKGGIQPDERIEKFVQQAIRFLEGQ